jgi:gas vesicle protein
VGAGLGLLFAPKSGAETQEDLKEHARRLREAAEDSMRDVEDRLGVARDGAKEHIESVKTAVDAGVQAAREARDELEQKLETTKAAYRAGVDAARQAVPDGMDAEDVLEVVD